MCVAPEERTPVVHIPDGVGNHGSKRRYLRLGVEAREKCGGGRGKHCSHCGLVAAAERRMKWHAVLQQSADATARNRRGSASAPAVVGAAAQDVDEQHVAQHIGLVPLERGAMEGSALLVLGAGQSDGFELNGDAVAHGGVHEEGNADVVGVDGADEDVRVGTHARKPRCPQPCNGLALAVHEGRRQDGCDAAQLHVGARRMRHPADDAPVVGNRQLLGRACGVHAVRRVGRHIGSNAVEQVHNDVVEQTAVGIDERGFRTRGISDVVEGRSTDHHIVCNGSGAHGVHQAFAVRHHAVVVGHQHDGVEATVGREQIAVD